MADADLETRHLVHLAAAIKRWARARRAAMETKIIRSAAGSRLIVTFRGAAAQVRVWEHCYRVIAPPTVIYGALQNPHLTAQRTCRRLIAKALS